jgi:hypothetical protein
MKIYVASAFTNKAVVQHWQAKLREIGVAITHDWTTAEAPPGPGGELTMPLEEQQKHALADVQGVLAADLVWIIAPETGGCGCWFEMGLAYGDVDGGVPRRIVVSGPRRTIFTSLVGHFTTHEEAFEVIKTLTRPSHEVGRLARPVRP